MAFVTISWEVSVLVGTKVASHRDQMLPGALVVGAECIVGAHYKLITMFRAHSELFLYLKGTISRTVQLSHDCTHTLRDASALKF